MPQPEDSALAEVARLDVSGVGHDRESRSVGAPALVFRLAPPSGHRRACGRGPAHHHDLQAAGLAIAPLRASTTPRSSTPSTPAEHRWCRRVPASASQQRRPAERGREHERSLPLHDHEQRCRFSRNAGTNLRLGRFLLLVQRGSDRGAFRDCRIHTKKRHFRMTALGAGSWGTVAACRTRHPPVRSKHAPPN